MEPTLGSEFMRVLKCCFIQQNVAEGHADGGLDTMIDRQIGNSIQFVLPNRSAMRHLRLEE